MIERTQIDRRVTFDVEYEYFKGIPALGSPAIVPAEPATVSISNVWIQGAVVCYHKPLWDALAERILEDYV